MIAPADCDKVLLVQAELDGELDAAEAAALAVHRADCPICQAAAADLLRARALIGSELRHAMPDEMRRRIAGQIAAATPAAAGGAGPERLWRRWWIGVAGFGVGAVCAAGLALLVIAPQQQALIGQIVDSHIRGLQPGHLEDVPSSDQHTVKPWFDGRIDFAPPVKELAAESFPLQGGRLDYVDGRPVAVLVYRHAKHIIDLYIWPAGGASAGAPTTATRNGYNLVHWTAGGMTFWAVSDLEAPLLGDFAADFRRSP